MDGRIRGIQPSIWTDAKFGMLSRDARLLFIGVISKAECCGVVLWSAEQLKVMVFPYDEDISNDQLDAMMGELEELELVKPYKSRDGGLTYGLIVNFHKHQTLHHPAIARCPAPPSGWPSEYLDALGDKAKARLRQWAPAASESVWIAPKPVENSQVKHGGSLSRVKFDKLKREKRINTLTLPLIKSEPVENSVGELELVENTYPLSNRFNLWWEAYPKKVNKNGSRSVWLELSPSASLFSAIMQALEEDKQSVSWNKDRMRHVPKPSVWLKQWLALTDDLGDNEESKVLR